MVVVPVALASRIAAALPDMIHKRNIQGVPSQLIPPDLEHTILLSFILALTLSRQPFYKFWCEAV